MFFKRLMGASPSNQGEVIKQVKDNLWQATPTGTLFWLVQPDLCQSSTGVYFRKTGLNVYGSDGTWYSSLDVLEKFEPITKKNKTSVQSQSNASGCLIFIVVLAASAVMVVIRNA